VAAQELLYLLAAVPHDLMLLCFDLFDTTQTLDMLNISMAVFFKVWPQQALSVTQLTASQVMAAPLILP